MGFDDILDENMQISGLMQSSSAQNWLSSQSSSSGLIVKRTIRVDIPVEKYPNVLMNFFCCIFYYYFLSFFFWQQLIKTYCLSLTLSGASLVLEATRLSESKLVQNAVF